MSVKRLREVSGEIQPSGAPPEGNDRIVRDAILVHAGEAGEAVTLHSSDGPIEFDDARIQAVVDSQNDLIDKMAEHYGGIDKIPSGAYPPILDQHEADSTNRVIGRLTGRLRFERRAVPKVGKDVACACASITFLGVETVDRVRDGRIFHLSIGIDEDTNTLTETSAVIDPAAPGAMILKRGVARLAAGWREQSSSKEYRTWIRNAGEITFVVNYIHKKYYWNVGRKAAIFAKGICSSLDEAQAAAEAAARKEPKRFKNTQGAKMPTKNPKAAERLKKLAAAQKSLKALSAKMVETKKTVSLAAAKASVTKRLSAVVRGGKMTPAEFKKIDVTKLAKLDRSALDVVVEAYEAREPQVNAGQRGTAAAMDFSDVGQSLETKQKKRLRSEIKGDFKRLGAKMKDVEADDEPKAKLKRLAEATIDETTKKLEDGDAPMDMPTVDGTEASPDMQQQIDEINTQLARIAGIVQDIVDAEGEGDQDDTADVGEGAELEGDKKDDTELEAGDDKEDDKSKNPSDADADEDKE